MIRIEIIGEATAYNAREESDCQSDAELSAYRSCLEMGEVILMGHILAIPECFLSMSQKEEG